MFNKKYKNEIFKGITRNVVVLGLVSLFTDLSSQMVFPLIPLFLTSVLGAGAYVVGIVEGAAETTASFIKILSGFWSDKIRRRKPFILFGYALSSFTKPLFAFAQAWPFVIFIRVIERIGKGIRNAPRDAIIAESVNENVRGKVYGFHRAMDGIGSVLGAVFAFILLPVLGFRNLFLFAFVPSIIAVFVIIFVKEAKNENKPVKKKDQDNIQKISFKDFPKKLKWLIIISGIFALSNFGYAFLLLRAKSMGFTDQTAIFLYALFYIAYVVCAIPSGMLSDKIGRKPLLAAAYVIFLITSFGLIFVSNIYSIILFFITYGIFYAMIDGVQRAFVADLAPKHLKATALGAFHMTIGLAALPGGLAAGLLWDKIGPTATFIYAIILSLISLLLLIFAIRKDAFSDSLKKI